MDGAKWGSVVVVMLAATACHKDNATTTTTTTSTSASASASATPLVTPAAAAQMAADEDQAADELRTHHRHHHGGVAMFVHMAIDTLGVPPQKKAQLDKIQADLFAAMAPARDANKAVISALADGVSAGNIDKSKVDAAIAKQQAAAPQVHAATIDALNALHNVLTPEERQALVDKVQAHAAVWKKVNDEDPASKDKSTHLASLTQRLALTPDQVDKISTALKLNAPPKLDTSALDAHLTAFATAFVANTFDAKTLSTANPANAHIAKDGTAHMVHFYEAVTPVLTPAQRTKLADHLRQRLTDRHPNSSTT